MEMIHEARTVDRFATPKGWLPFAIVSFILLAATVPFLNKAVHIDDALYLRVAEQILKTPMDPYGYASGEMVVWDAPDGRPASLFATDFNPPLWKYLLAGTFAIAGRDERVLHLMSAVVLALGTWGLYRVSVRLTSRPVWCVAMILWAPFFLPGQNLMLEVPLLASVVWGAYFQWRSWDSGRGTDSFIAGIFVGLAVLTKYTAGLLIPLLFIGSLMRGRPRSFLFLVPAGALVGAWCLHNGLMYGELHLTSHGVVFQPELWPARVLTVCRIVGAVSFLGPTWWVALWRRGRVGRLVLLTIFLLAAGLSWIDLLQASARYERLNQGVPLRTGILFLLFTTLGSATLFSIAAESVLSFRADSRQWKASFDDRQLELWLVVILLFNVVSVPFNAVRHLLIAFLVMTWLTARVIDRLQLRRLPAIMLVVSSVVGFLLAGADYEFANTYRDVARTRVREDLGRYPAVWFCGTWGFKYYAEQEGAIAYFQGMADQRRGFPIAGDRVYYPRLHNWVPAVKTIRGATLTEAITPPAHWTLRTMLPGVSYYGVDPHYLPWGVLFVVKSKEGVPTLEQAPIDLIEIYDVMPVP